MKKLIILTGGNSLERQISLKSCENILNLIDKSIYKIKVIEIPTKINQKGWIKQILNFKPDIIFNTLHGGMGEDGTIQGFLDTLSLKYVGSKSFSSSICMDKKFSKNVMCFNKIPVLPDVFLKKNDNISLFLNEIKELGFPLIIKPNKCGASIGLYLAHNMTELENYIEKVKLLNDDILIEKYFDGQEVTCFVVEKNDGLFVLPLLDINKNGIFDFSAKYIKKSDINFSNLPNFIQKMIQEIAKKTFLALKCEGYASIDLIVKEEEIYVLEVNTIPGMTKKSLLPKAIEIQGSNFSDFFNEIIEYRLNKNN